ncbi:hypothetical protein BST10_16710 [Mycolicibacter algericus DSM 45454]|jgi:hypothetical protein|uniref:Uncharacterized protein n=2 Tax=Mycolicibacter algericus TaxID=1288388 RepID=A0A7I9Y5P1_MYCAL|nr:hypothetical protein BST10_16710 [Mycolicibacter algericus DSM 45454]GFG83981.1 hypothetical protein MALGJ_06570 [Mycolicibacter algericus]
MSADELTSFLGEEPTGAICLTDVDGALLAVPARVLSHQDDLLKVEISGLDMLPAPGTAACVVADRFSSYESIRGVIAQGSIASTPRSGSPRPTVAVALARTVTFSFANVTR